MVETDRIADKDHQGRGNGGDGNSGGGDGGRDGGRSGADMRVPLGVQAAVYATGAFANSTHNVVGVILPLWALYIGASPFMIGIVIGSWHFLMALLSIHGGALMDRLGTRRVVLWLGALAAISPLLFPVLPWIWAAIILQMIGGLASNYGWMGAQAQIGQVMKGSPIYAGRLSFAVRGGQMLGPPLAGLSWDLGGPWAAFILLALWGTGMFVSSFGLPRPDAKEGTFEATQPVTMRALMPRLGDYINAFKMLAIPAIGLVVMVTSLRMAGNGIQASFYVVYLEGVGYTGTMIGFALGAAGALGFAGAISIGPLSRLVRPYWLLLSAVACSVIGVAITPLIGGFFFLLVLTSALRGAALGLSQPLMISIISQAAGSGNQGKGVALRTTANRTISTVIPVLMGAVVEIAGIAASFYILGAVLLALVGLLGLYMKRSPGLNDEA